MKTKTILITLIIMLVATAFVFQSCKKDDPTDPNSPTATFSVSPESGTTNTTFTFDATGSTDTEDPTSDLQVRWDYDGDGSWDTNWDTDKIINHVFSSEGTYKTNLEVKNTEDFTDQYTKSITVSMGSGITGTFTDPRDGQVYNTIEIGSQTWFAENINFKTSTSLWYDSIAENGEIYGSLYKWYESKTIVCPNGWHLPSDNEWKTLEMYLGMSQSEADNESWRGTDEGKKMKSTSGWNLNGNGIDKVGFTALPGGLYISFGIHYLFKSIGKAGVWWTATPYDQWNAYDRAINYDTDKINRYGTGKSFQYSVRCVKD